MRYIIFALICLVASCGAAGTQPARGQQAIGYTTQHMRLVQAFGGDVFFEQPDGPGAPTPHLKAGSWVQYACTAAEGMRNDHLQVIPFGPDGGSFPGEYWVGVQNRERSCWKWFGPFSSYGDNAEPAFGHNSYLPATFDWDLVTNGNSVVIYCTKPFAMDGITFGFIPAN